MILSEEKKNKIMLLAQQTGVGVIKSAEALTKFDYDYNLAKQYVAKNYSKVFNSSEGDVKRFCTAISSDKKTLVLGVFSCSTDFGADTEQFKSFMKEYVNNLLNDINFNNDVLINIVSNQIGEAVSLVESSIYNSANFTLSSYVHFDNKQVVILEHDNLNVEIVKILCINALMNKISDVTEFLKQDNILNEKEKLGSLVNINSIQKIEIIKVS